MVVPGRKNLCARVAPVIVAATRVGNSSSPKMKIWTAFAPGFDGGYSTSPYSWNWSGHFRRPVVELIWGGASGSSSGRRGSGSDGKPFSGLWCTYSPSFARHGRAVSASGFSSPPPQAPATRTNGTIAATRHISRTLHAASGELAADDVPDQEEQVRGALAEAARQVRVPLGAERGRDEDVVAAARELELELRAHAEEHLDLERVARGCLADRALDQPLVVRRDGDERARLNHPRHESRVRGVDVDLARHRHLRRLEVRALYDPQVRVQRQERLEVARRAVQVRLEDGPDVVEACLAQPPVRAQRRVDVPRLLHVDADEGAAAARVLDEPEHVRVRELLVDVEAEVGELQRHVAAQPLVGEPVDDRNVLRRHALRLGLVADALAEERRVRRQPLLVQAAQDGHRLVDRLARDEATRAELHPVSPHRPPRARAVGGSEDRAPQPGVHDFGRGHPANTTRRFDGGGEHPRTTVEGRGAGCARRGDHAAATRTQSGGRRSGKRGRPSSGIGSHAAAYAANWWSDGRIPGSPSIAPRRTPFRSGSAGCCEKTWPPQAV